MSYEPFVFRGAGCYYVTATEPHVESIATVALLSNSRLRNHLVAKLSPERGPLCPEVNGDIACDVEGSVVVWHEDMITDSVEAESLLRHAFDEVSEWGGTVVAANDVLGISIPRPPAHHSGRWLDRCWTQDLSSNSADYDRLKGDRGWIDISVRFVEFESDIHSEGLAGQHYGEALGPLVVAGVTRPFPVGVVPPTRLLVPPDISPVQIGDDEADLLPGVGIHCRATRV